MSASARPLLLVLAVPWCLLWLGVALLENPRIVHDPLLPLWQPAIIFGSSGLAAVGLLTLWHRWGASRGASAVALVPWFRAQLLPMPVYIALALGLTYGIRLSVFAAAGARYSLTPADSYPAYQILKVAIFYCLWLGLALGARLVAEGREQHRALSAARDLIDARSRAADSGLERRILVPLGDRLKPVDIDSICWIEADDNYVRIHTATQDYAVRKALQDMLIELGEDRFVRIHRSAAINIGEIEAIRPLPKGDAEIRLKCGATLRMSRRFRQAVFKSHSPSQ